MVSRSKSPTTTSKSEKDENVRRRGRAESKGGNATVTQEVLSKSQILRALRALARGEGNIPLPDDLNGVDGQIAHLVQQLAENQIGFEHELVRLRELVGREGRTMRRLGRSGTRTSWSRCAASINDLLDDITTHTDEMARVVNAVSRGDLSQRMGLSSDAPEARGDFARHAIVVNGMVEQLSVLGSELTRVTREFGLDGKLGAQANIPGASGAWKELADGVNLMASHLTAQVREIARVTTAVARGDLSKTVTIEVRGELLELKNTINTMVDQLSSFADEVTRVAREVGTEGILGGQAQVRGVSGTWRKLTDNANIMARNLTEQVRGIARVVTAVANGDLKHELRLDAKGEIATLVETINNMLVTLSTFTDQVSGVARDVGLEGRLGGQADVPSAAGVWRVMTNNVNELAGNLTRQVRAIGDVATAVTTGDLTQTIDVEARGEVALLKDNINQMIRTLADTTRVNREQDWLKTNLTRFTRMLQGQRDLLTVAEQVLGELAPAVNAQYGTFYLTRREDESVTLDLFAAYAFTNRKHTATSYTWGEGIVGQVAREKKRVVVSYLPPDYVTISSSLGETPPINLVVVPLLFEGETKGVIELASLEPFTNIQLAFIDQLVESVGIVLATIEATMRTDELLRQAQSMAEVLQDQQEELRQTNEELEEKARQLTLQKDEVEQKNHLVNLAKAELEEKAEQLALTSKYKSQFLANMSHELRTPLNSLLILSRQLAENTKGNLNERQVEYAQTIYQSGNDLLELINEILDLAKIESGTMPIDVSVVEFRDLQQYVERSFGQVASEKGLAFEVVLADTLPDEIHTDDLRLRQVLRNLVSNAIKFTAYGTVRLVIEPQEDCDWPPELEALREANLVIAFRVTDTGIGIPKEQQALIFEAFQQAEGGTSRTYGGTGLGLSISREIAFLLGGDLRVQSAPELGSTFALFLPQKYASGRQQSGRPLFSTNPKPRRPKALSEPPPAAGSDTNKNVASRPDTILKSKKAKVLIVDDDPRNIDALALMLTEKGYVVEGVDSGERALEYLDELHAVDVIVLDIMMPGMDGYEVLRRVRSNSQWQSLPVIAVTAKAMPGDKERCIDAGASDYVTKPVDSDYLLSRLEHFTHRPSKNVRVRFSP